MYSPLNFFLLIYYIVLYKLIKKMNTLKKLKINNVFGIKPSLNHEAAGLDFYIPNIPVDIT